MHFDSEVWFAGIVLVVDCSDADADAAAVDALLKRSDAGLYALRRS